MKIFCTIFSLLIFYISKSQTDTSGTYIAISQTAHLIVKGTWGGKETEWHGNGFILNDNYLATCFHVIEDTVRKALEIKVIFNIDPHSNSYDSVFATVDYKAKRNQYNFKKHKFIKSDAKTDFIILKLRKKITTKYPTFDTSQVDVGEWLSTTKLIHFIDVNGTKGFFTEIAYQIAVFYDTNFPFLIPNEMMSIGYAQEGYSGSPLFNRQGMIVGMMNGGYGPDESKRIITTLRNEGKISVTKGDELLTLLKNNPQFRIGISTNIKYLVTNYISGYLTK